MGTVYLGENLRTRQRAAVKVMSDALTDQPGFRQRFAREIAILQKIQGPFVAAVVDGDAYNERPWLATEFVPGPDLARMVRELGPLDAQSWTGLAVGLLTALTHIHDAGIVHRDLKPANILLSTDGPKVIDFGVAQLLDATALTSTGTALGTPGWLAPEQIRGVAASPAADAFSAGAVLAYAATGRAPFGREHTPAAAMQAVLNGAPDLSGTRDAQLSVLVGLLDKDPSTRWTPERALAYLVDGGESTVIAKDATRMWQRGEVAHTLVAAESQFGVAPSSTARTSHDWTIDSRTPHRHGRSARRRSVAAAALLTGLTISAVVVTVGSGILPVSGSDAQLPSAAAESPEAEATPSRSPKPTPNSAKPAAKSTTSSSEPEATTVTAAAWDTFPMSVRGVQATTFERAEHPDGTSSVSARVTEADAREYCERNPGDIKSWRTYEGRQACVEDLLTQEGGFVYTAQADCSRGTLRPAQPSREYLKSYVEAPDSDYTWQLLNAEKGRWRNTTTGEENTGSTAGGGSIMMSQFEHICGL